MATVTKEVLTCDLCGNANDVQTRAFGFDGKQYEIDLCPKDGNGLSEVVEGCIPNARKVKVTTSKGQRPNGRKRPSRATRASDGAKAARSQPRKAKPPAKQATKTDSGQQDNSHSQRPPRANAASDGAKTAPSQPRKAKPPAKQATNTDNSQQREEKGVYVYGILPADIEIADETLGVGEHPNPLGLVRSDGIAALISEVDRPGQLGSPEDLRTYRDILDSTAVEVPVLPLRFGTVVAGEGAVTDELLAPRHDEFTAALEQLEGHAEFVVKGRYVREAVRGEAFAENEQAAQLRATIRDGDPAAAQDAKAELSEILDERIAVMREEDTRALRQAMEGVCVASVVRKPAHRLDAIDVAFLVAADEEDEMERVVDDLAREWEGRIEVRLLGPMAAYDFMKT